MEDCGDETIKRKNRHGQKIHTCFLFCIKFERVRETSLFRIPNDFPYTVGAEAVFFGKHRHRLPVPVFLHDRAVAFVILGAGTGLAAPRLPLLRRFRDIDRLSLDIFSNLYQKFLRQNFLCIYVAYKVYRLS